MDRRTSLVRTHKSKQGWTKLHRPCEMHVSSAKPFRILTSVSSGNLSPTALTCTATGASPWFQHAVLLSEAQSLSATTGIGLASLGKSWIRWIKECLFIPNVKSSRFKQQRDASTCVSRAGRGRNTKNCISCYSDSVFAVWTHISQQFEEWCPPLLSLVLIRRKQGSALLRSIQMPDVFILLLWAGEEWCCFGFAGLICPVNTKGVKHSLKFAEVKGNPCTEFNQQKGQARDFSKLEWVQNLVCLPFVQENKSKPNKTKPTKNTRKKQSSGACFSPTWFLSQPGKNCS